MEQTINEIAEYIFGFDIKPRNSDGYDFFDNDRGTISVRGWQGLWSWLMKLARLPSASVWRERNELYQKADHSISGHSHNAET